MMLVQNRGGHILLDNAIQRRKEEESINNTAEQTDLVSINNKMGNKHTKKDRRIEGLSPL